MKLCYDISSDKVHMLPLIRPIGLPKKQLCDFANNAGRYSRTKQALRGLSAIAELLVLRV